MKVPNVNFGTDFRNDVTQNQMQFTKKKTLEGPNTRRADLSNPNRIPTVGFGFGAEKGSNEDHLVHRNTGNYNHFFIPKKGEMNPKIAKTINSHRGQYNLGNNFEYGLDSRGGISARNYPVKQEDIKKFLDESAVSHQIRGDNKDKIEK